MHYSFQRRYRGPLQAVVLDWAGTIVDYGSFAPVVAISRAFGAFGVEVTPADVRHFMGSHKRQHVQNVGELPGVAARWRAAHGRDFNATDGDAVFRKFLEVDAECVAEYSRIIPGAVEAFAAFRERGLKIGTTTGYIREIMERVAEQARMQGLVPDAILCANDTRAARPAPWMCFHLAEELDFWPLESAVKIGDTLIDVEEGLNAGMWTIGLAATGNLLGLTQREAEALSDAEREARLVPVRAALAHAGAHFVVDSIADCLPVLDEIDARLMRGERP